MVSKRKEVFLESLDTTNLLNGYRGEDLPDGAAPHVSELFMDAMIVLNSAKKKDVKTWWLRQLKATYLQESVPADKYDKKELKFFKTRLSSQGSGFSPATPEEIMESYHHFIQDSEVPAIQNFQYEQQTFDEVADTFANFERAYMDVKESQIEPNWQFETVLKDYGDFVFVDLGVSGSRVEGDAMGHCGNGQGRPDQRVFSLRQKQPNGTLIPKATLIGNNCAFDDTGAVTSCSLGEIKGSANEKVSKKYRHMIGDAIASLGIFKSKVSGDYKPEVDLSLFDFDDEIFSEIVEKVPTYANPFEAAYATNFEGGELLDASIENYFQIDPNEDIAASDVAFFANVLNSAELAGGAELRKDVNDFVNLVESPAPKFFEMLPDDLKSDMLQVAKAEGLQDEKHLREHMETKSSLSGFYNGLMANYLKDDVYPALKEMTGVLEGVFGYTVVEKNRGVYDIVTPVNVMTKIVAEKLTINSDGNPMNNIESHKIMHNFNRFGASYMRMQYGGSLIQKAKNNEELKAAFEKLQVGEFSNKAHLTMFSTFLNSAKDLMNIQNEQGLSMNKGLTQESSIVASNGGVIVAIIEQHKAQDIASKLGIDLSKMRDETMHNFRGSDIKGSDLFNNSYAVIRKRGEDGIDEDIGLASCGSKAVGRRRGLNVTRIEIPDQTQEVVNDLVTALTSDKSELKLSKSTKFNRGETGTQFLGLHMTTETEVAAILSLDDMAALVGAKQDVVDQLSGEKYHFTSRVGKFIDYLDSGRDFRVTIPSQDNFGETIPQNYKENLQDQFERAKEHFMSKELNSSGWGNGDGGTLKMYNSYLSKNDLKQHMMAHGGNEFKAGETVKDAMARIASNIEFEKFESKFNDVLEKKFERLKSKDLGGISFVDRIDDELVFNITDKAAFLSSLSEKFTDEPSHKRESLNFDDISEMQVGRMLTALVERKMINDKINVEVTEAHLNKIFIGGVVGGMIRDVLGTENLEDKNSFEGRILGSIEKKGLVADTQNQKVVTQRPNF